jgi:hypothetical protein
MVRGIFSRKWILRVIGSFSTNVGAVVFGCCIAQLVFNMVAVVVVVAVFYVVAGIDVVVHKKLLRYRC